MREFIRIVEDTLVRPEWRAAMLAAAQQPESLFTAVQPEESGLDRTVYASETPEHPVVIVDSRKGKQFAPDDAATVLAFDERTGLPIVDQWLAINSDALRAYCNGDYDSVDFYAAMRPVKLDEAVRLDEMANFRKGRFNSPLTFWIRPEPNPWPHEARVKCNANYADKPSDQNFSIQLLPTPSLATKDGEPHDTGSVSTRDVEGMIRWVGRHQQTFLDFYSGKINQADLEQKLSEDPYS
jgi:hypothetical protein